MTEKLPLLNAARALQIVGIAMCGSLLLAASCEKKPPTPITSDDAPASNNAQVDAGASTAAQVMVPKDAGPKAPAIFMLSSLKGYTEPCGCTLDVMLGGIDRIAGYVTAATPLYEDVYVVDGGDLFFEEETLEEHAIPQEKAKVDAVVAGLKKIGVKLTVPGERDFALGAAYYEEKVAAAGIKPIAANLTIEGKELPAVHQEGNRLFVGIADPALYEGVKATKVSDPKAALEKLSDQIAAADVTVLMVHGELPFAKEMLAAAPKADFALVGHGPRETDQVDQMGEGFTLEPYDQGRFLGILKLYNTTGAAGGSFTDARPTSKAELEKVQRQIEHVNESINKMPPATPGDEPAVLLTLRERLNKLQARLDELKHAAIDVPADKPAFLWRSIALEPGFPVDPQVEQAREAYNAELKKLNSSLERDVIPVEPGKAEFIGTDNCTMCHQSSKTFWDDTMHSKAWATLVDRNKDFDQKCVGCHSVGYDQPGGSVIGKFEYDTTVKVMGGTEAKLHKNLVDVGCESCHGPGSLHIAAPTNAAGESQNIIVDPTVEQCNQCHVSEHSPRFRFDVYVEEITGEGHARSSK